MDSPAMKMAGAYRPQPQIPQSSLQDLFSQTNIEPHVNRLQGQGYFDGNPMQIEPSVPQKSLQFIRDLLQQRRSNYLSEAF
jgi:hypothetical protein